MKIDAYSHILPRAYFDRLVEIAPDKGAIKRWLTIPVLHDLDARLAMMEEFGPDYRQILTLSMPALESVAGPDETPALARLANDSMADLVARRPDRFPGFVASLGLNNVSAALAEMRRAIEELGAIGIQLFTNVGGRPLDEPEFWPVFEAIAQYDLPIWLHPTRGAGCADYSGERKSKYEIWWTFGWPYETSAAMARLVFGGVMDQFPNLKVLAHHLGAMVPFFEGRVGPGWDQLGNRTTDEDYKTLRANMKRRPLDYFKDFYADSAVFGSKPATECGLAFYGADRVLFASDCPFDPEKGPGYIRETIAIIEGLNLSQEDREKICYKNAQSLLKIK